MVIDFHTHTFPEKVAAKAIAGMQQKHHAAVFSDGTASGLRRSMDAAGVDVSVVLPVATNPLKLSSINDVSVAETGNNRLIYFGAMHPLAENWKEELDRIAAAGIRGIKLHPFYQGTDVDDLRMLRIYGRAAELGLLVVIHAGDEIAYPGQVRCTPRMAASAIRQVGNGFAPILAHMGGWKNWEQVTEHLVNRECYIDTAISLGSIVPMEGATGDPEELALLSDEAFVELVRAFGSNRILFGTDSPWSSPKEELLKIERLPLTEQERTEILHQNAVRLLKLL